jgi:hypothetical protein
MRLFARKCPIDTAATSPVNAAAIKSVTYVFQKSPGVHAGVRRSTRSLPAAAMPMAAMVTAPMTPMVTATPLHVLDMRICDVILIGHRRFGGEVRFRLGAVH